jgi:hypothetical protein
VAGIVIAVIPLIVNVSHPAIFTILSSISIVLIYLSYLQWGGVIFVGTVVIGGALRYRLRIRHRTGVLTEHAAAAVVPQEVPAGDFEPQRVS